MPRTITRRSATPEPVNDVPDETPTRGRSRSTTEAAPAASRRASKVEERPSGRKPKAAAGWGAVSEAVASVGNYTQDLKLTDDEEILVKFVEEEPYDVYLQHWIERGKGKKKSFTCTEEDDCPLCEIGDTPSAQVCFNVIRCDVDTPVLYRWRVGVMVANIIKGLSEDRKTSPVNREDIYFAVKRTNSNGRYATSVTAVKARDLREDWDLDPIPAEDFSALAESKYDVSSTEVSSYEDLDEVATEIADR